MQFIATVSRDMQTKCYNNIICIVVDTKTLSQNLQIEVWIYLGGWTLKIISHNLSYMRLYNLSNIFRYLHILYVSVTSKLYMLDFFLNNILWRIYNVWFYFHCLLQEICLFYNFFFYIRYEKSLFCIYKRIIGYEGNDITKVSCQYSDIYSIWIKVR